MTKLFSIHSALMNPLLLLAAAIPACASQPPEAPIATLAATAPSHDIGVASWEVYKEDDAVRIVGLDATDQRRAEMVVAQSGSGDSVHVQVAFPEQREFEFARGGAITGDTSPFVDGLRVAMNADLAEQTTSLTPDSHGGLGTAASNVFLQGEGHIPMGWSMFGYRADVEVNGWCGSGGLRASYDAYSSSGASCWVNRWLSYSPYDCRISVHYGISGWRTDTCNWYVYSNP